MPRLPVNTSAAPIGFSSTSLDLSTPEVYKPGSSGIFSLIAQQAQLRNRMAERQLELMQEEINLARRRRREGGRQKIRGHGMPTHGPRNMQDLYRRMLIGEAARNVGPSRTGLAGAGYGNLISTLQQNAGGPTGSAGFQGAQSPLRFGGAGDLLGAELQGGAAMPAGGAPVAEAGRKGLRPWQQPNYPYRIGQGIVEAQGRYGIPIAPGTTFTNASLAGFEKGGTVPKTGPYELHKGEIVISADQVDDPLLEALMHDKLRKLKTGQMDGKGTGPGKVLGSYQAGSVELGDEAIAKAYDELMKARQADAMREAMMAEQALGQQWAAGQGSAMTAPQGPRTIPNWREFISAAELTPAEREAIERWGRSIETIRPELIEGGALVPRGAGGVATQGGELVERQIPDFIYRRDLPGGVASQALPAGEAAALPGGRAALPSGGAAALPGGGSPALRSGAAATDDVIRQAAKETGIPVSALRKAPGLLKLILGGAALAGGALALSGDKAAPGRRGGATSVNRVPGAPPREMTPEILLALEAPESSAAGTEFAEQAQRARQMMAPPAPEQPLPQEHMGAESLAGIMGSLQEEAAPVRRPNSAAIYDVPLDPNRTEEQQVFNPESEAWRKAEHDRFMATMNEMKAERLEDYLAANAGQIDKAMHAELSGQAKQLRQTKQTLDKRMEDRRKNEATLFQKAQQSIDRYHTEVEKERIRSEAGEKKMDKTQRFDLFRDVRRSYEDFVMAYHKGELPEEAMEAMADLWLSQYDYRKTEGDPPLSREHARIFVMRDLGEVTDEEAAEMIRDLEE